MSTPPFPLRSELGGWQLFWARLAMGSDGVDLDPMRRRVAEEARQTYGQGQLSAHPTVAALRGLFRAAGCDPTRYRPSSEALLRRVLKGGDLPAIHPLVDLNNCLSLRLAVPCCVLAQGSFFPPLVLRAGRQGETMVSLRGPFNLAGKPLLADEKGPLGSPITDSERVKVKEDTHQAWLVAYLPEGVVTPASTKRELSELATLTGGIRIED